jgi:hypothetical protein
MLLVLLTISALALSGNSLRSAIASGTLRQAHMAENVADAGLEWTVYWMGQDPNTPSLRPAATGGALLVQNQMSAMQVAGNFGIANTTLTSSDFTVTSSTNVTTNYDVTLTLMGQLNPSYQAGGPNITSTTAVSVTALDLWSVVVNGYVTYPNGQTFTHRREVWVTTPQT